MTDSINKETLVAQGSDPLADYYKRTDQKNSPAASPTPTPKPSPQSQIADPLADYYERIEQQATPKATPSPHLPLSQQIHLVLLITQPSPIHLQHQLRLRRLKNQRDNLLQKQRMILRQIMRTKLVTRTNY
jgi:hypothetical protein